MLENSKADLGNLYNLVIAVVKRAKEDYITGRYQLRKDVETFMLSEYYNLFTGFDNGKSALSHWEDLRLDNLGQGDIKYGKLHLIEGAKILNQEGSQTRMARQSLIIMADSKSEAFDKAFDYGIINNKAYIYNYAELSGCNKIVAKKLDNSEDKIVLAKSESM